LRKEGKKGEREKWRGGKERKLVFFFFFFGKVDFISDRERN
jgi:hypothetical protein